MDWKCLYKLATPAEREEIVMILLQRICPQEEPVPLVKPLPLLRARSRIHWMGRADRRRRPERAVFTGLFLGTLVVAGPQRHLLWATSWGGMLAIFLNMLTIYKAFPRKRAHWIG